MRVKQRQNERVTSAPTLSGAHSVIMSFTNNCPKGGK